MRAPRFAVMEVVIFAVHVLSRVAQLVNRNADSTVEITGLLRLLWV